MNLGPEDDSMVLETFKPVAEAYQWPQELWANKTVLFLTGEAQEAYWSLGTALAWDYKIAILDHLGLTEEAYECRFVQEAFDPHAQPQAVTKRLKDFCTH